LKLKAERMRERYRAKGVRQRAKEFLAAHFGLSFVSYNPASRGRREVMNFSLFFLRITKKNR
jgi:hypothetical protein